VGREDTHGLDLDNAGDSRGVRERILHARVREVVAHTARHPPDGPVPGAENIDQAGPAWFVVAGQGNARNYEDLVQSHIDVQVGEAFHPVGSCRRMRLLGAQSRSIAPLGGMPEEGHRIDQEGTGGDRAAEGRSEAAPAARGGLVYTE
jgi:hypothetical protein